ncbi:acyl carrier protein [Streptomyces sp. NPDC050759]|uniref:acyl carrier protein n=1 Tax=Streptomyces sp. NPDC050759 TaxID=3365635 RepID=UPI00378ED00D
MPARTVTVVLLEEWITERIAEYLEIPAEDIEVDENITHYGVDSLARTTLGADIEDEYGVEVEPDFFKDRTTIEEIAAGLPQIISGATGVAAEGQEQK